MDGSRVEEMILTGRIDELARYCESDVLKNCHVWLRYELFRGSINTAELGWSERQVGDYVTTRKATNPHLLTAVGISKSIGMLFPVSGAD
jgi:hypothetical protein